MNALRDLEVAFDAANDVRRVGPGRVLVANPEAARDVLGNRAGDYVDTSDFFFTRRGVFGPRPAQVAIGRLGRDLLQRHVDARRGDLARLVSQRLAPASGWPDAGNLLVYEHVRDVLLAPGTPAPVRAVVDGVVHRAVLAGARQRYSRRSRRAVRRRAMRVLGREAGSRRAGEPRDLLDAVVAGAGPAATGSSTTTSGTGPTPTRSTRTASCTGRRAADTTCRSAGHRRRASAPRSARSS